MAKGADLLSERIMVQLTENEAFTLRTLANFDGRTISGLARRFIVKGLLQMEDDLVRQSDERRAQSLISSDSQTTEEGKDG